MKKWLIITFIIYPLMAVPREIDASHSYSDAYKKASKAFLALPVVKKLNKKITSKGYKVLENSVGITKYHAGYIVGVGASLFKGEINTKVFKNFRWKSKKGLVIRPNIMYDIDAEKFNGSVEINLKF